MLTAVEKIRLQLSGDPSSDPSFKHEGPNVVRWITGGTESSAYVVFHHDGSEIAACCPHCEQKFGRFDAGYGHMTYQQLRAIRRVADAHSCWLETS